MLREGTQTRTLRGLLRDEWRRDDGAPFLGVVVCVLIPLIPTVAVLPGPLKGQGSPARLLGLLAFLLVVVGFMTKRSGPRRMNWGAAILLVFLTVQMLTYFTGALAVGSPFAEANKTRVAVATVAYVGVGLYITTSVHYQRQRRILMGSLLVGLSWATLVGILQSVARLDVRSLFVPPGFVDILPVAGLMERGVTVRVVGTSDHAIEFVVLTAVTILLAMHMARFAETRPRRRAAVVALALGCFAVPLAVSRTGILVLLAMLAVYALALPLRLLANVAVVGAGMMLAYKIIYPGPFNSLLASVIGASTDDSITTRTDDYSAVSEMFRAHPWLGIGLGGNPPPEFRFLDNQWLQAVVQGGVVGVCALVLLVAGGVVGIVTGVRRAANRRERDQQYALGAAFVGVCVSLFTFDLFSFQQATMILFVLFALVWAGPSSTPGPDQDRAATDRRFDSSRSHTPSPE